MKVYRPLSTREVELATIIVDAGFRVHKALGPGLLEKVYESCFCHELSKRGVAFQRPLAVPIVYDDLVFEEGLRLDVLVEDSIICELKAVDQMNPVWNAQLLSQMKITGKRLGVLINFSVPMFSDGITRKIL